MIKEKDIETIKSELDITYDEAKHLLIKNRGDVLKTFENFVSDFRFNS